MVSTHGAQIRTRQHIRTDASRCRVFESNDGRNTTGHNAEVCLKMKSLEVLRATSPASNKLTYVPHFTRRPVIIFNPCSNLHDQEKKSTTSISLDGIPMTSSSP